MNPDKFLSLMSKVLLFVVIKNTSSLHSMWDPYKQSTRDEDKFVKKVMYFLMDGRYIYKAF